MESLCLCSIQSWQQIDTEQKSHYAKYQLEQLDRLRSAIPRRPMITHTSDSHQIPSQNKTKYKVQILKNCQKFKF